MSTPFHLGKLPLDVLAALLGPAASPDPRIILGPGIGLDAAVIDMGDRLLVAKTDPIPFATDSIGWYAVHVNANDIATTGAAPRWFLATLLLPAGQADESLAKEIFAQLYQACENVGARLVGGHTEITLGLDRPIIAGTMLGEVARDRLVTPKNVRPGDAVLLSKGIAIEGTAVIARETDISGELDRSSPGLAERCRRFLVEPGISVVRDAAIAISAGRIHAMHDPTEGGLATGLYEIAQASGTGLLIQEAAVPIYPETAAVCRALDLDPWGLIASGALLMVVDAADAPNVVRALEAQAIPAAIIGQVVGTSQGIQVSGPGGLHPLKRFAHDELARLFENSR